MDLILFVLSILAIIGQAQLIIKTLIHITICYLLLTERCRREVVRLIEGDVVASTAARILLGDRGRIRVEVERHIDQLVIDLIGRG